MQFKSVSLACGERQGKTQAPEELVLLNQLVANVKTGGTVVLTISKSFAASSSW